MEGDSQHLSAPVEQSAQEETKNPEVAVNEEPQTEQPLVEVSTAAEVKPELVTEESKETLPTQESALANEVSEAPKTPAEEDKEESKDSQTEPKNDEAIPNLVEADDEDTSDSEIEGVHKSEQEAEKFLRVVEESKSEVYEALLANQKAYDATYIAYLREIKKLNMRFETQFQEVFHERKPTSSKIEKFWATVLKSNPATASLIHPKDEPLLEHITDVSYSEAKHGREITLKFEFSENNIIANSELIKTYLLDSDDNLKAVTNTPIQWKGDDLTMKKIVETQKNKRSKAVKKVTKFVKDESFFNFFKDEEECEESDCSEEDMCCMQGEDLEIGFEIRDEVVPYAFLWFLGVRTHSELDDEEEPKEGHAKASAQMDASGGNSANCKQQ